jgi:hypothetical protein
MLRLGDVVHWNTGDSTFATLTNYTTYITYMSPAYDYQIYLPAKKRTISIYDIISEQTSMGEGSGGCMNPISSFMQDGQQIKNPDPYYVYIHN